MYESHFRLHSRPFSPAADIHAYVGIGPIEEARQNIVRAVERGSGPAVVIGGAGTGKSMLCQVIAEQFRQQTRVAMLANGRLGGPRALYQAVLFALNLPYRELDESELRLSLVDFLSSDERCPHGILLVIDEAHLLPLRLLEEVRMMTNIVRDGKPRVQLIIAGGPLLEERLARPKLDSFNQRIAARCYLDSFNREQTSAFIQEQLAMAGAPNKELFGGDALKAVYDATDGIPRLVNQLCDHALVMAAVGRHRAVDAAIVQEAWSDLQQLPTPWIDSPAHAGPAQSESEAIEFGALSDDSDDGSPASIPFPSGGKRKVKEVAVQTESSSEPDPHEQLDEIERHVAAVSEVDEPALDDEAAQTIEPYEDEGAHVISTNPFDEAFDEEETVVDSYASLQDSYFADAPRVRSAEGREIAAMLATVENQQHCESAVVDSYTHTLVMEETAQEHPATSQDFAVDASEAQRQQRDLTDAVAAILPKDHPQEASAEEVESPSAYVLHSAETEPPKVDPHGDDRDLIIVQEEAESEEEAATPGEGQSRVRRQKYRQLFARLRQA